MPTAQIYWKLPSVSDWSVLARAYCVRSFPGVRPESIYLPISTKPPIRTFLHHAHLTGVLDRKFVEGFSSNNYINLYARNLNAALPLPNTEQENLQLFLDFDPYTGFNFAPNLPFIQHTEWDNEWTTYSEEDLVARMLDCLKRGCYVIARLNEFYLPKSATWLKLCIRHETLIYGFDKKHDSFLCAGYDRGSIYGTLKLPRQLLHAAITRLGQTDSESDKGICKVTEVFIHPHSPPSIDLAAILRQLNAFIESVPVGDRIVNAVYGAHVYNYIARYFQAFRNRGRLPDMRWTRLIWERQKIMHLRTRKLESLGLAQASKLTCLASDQEKLAHSLHLRCFDAQEKRIRNSNGLSFLSDYSILSAREVEFSLELRSAMIRFAPLSIAKL